MAHDRASPSRIRSSGPNSRYAIALINVLVSPVSSREKSPHLSTLIMAATELLEKEDISSAAINLGAGVLPGLTSSAAGIVFGRTV